MNDNRWQLNRAGLINFWYYDDEEFEFAGGKLLLRGSNGSGKSVTMQSLVPLLLDGNKSPERLDPFGSKARKIENYLLGDEESAKEESIGYLYFEYKKQESDQYMTIGMGLKAKKGSPVKSWGFSITDGRRIGRDFYLYKEGVEKIPLTMKELQNRIGTGGHVLENQGDYKKHVNDILFGFSDIDEYDELIKLLVQLRTPKLSKEFRPSVIYEIMENSLQPLSEDDLRPMSEAIENMDNIKSKFDELKESKIAIDKLKASFDNYNELLLFEKAKLCVDSKKILNDTENQIKIIKTEINQFDQLIKEKNMELTNLDIQYKTSEQKRYELETNDSVKIYEKLTNLNDDLKDVENQIEIKNSQLDKKLSKDLDYHQKLKLINDQQNSTQNKIKQIIQELDDCANEFIFEEQSFLSQELLTDLNKEYRFNYVKGQLNRYTELLDQALDTINQLEIKNKEYDEVLKTLDESKFKKAESEKYLESCKTLLQETKDEYIEKVIHYNKTNQELVISTDQLVLINREINQLSDSFDYLNNLFRNMYNDHHKELTSITHDWDSKLTQINKNIEKKQSEISEWKSKKDPEPLREEKVINNRVRLKEANIPFVPFYLTVDFKVNDESLNGKIEEALIDMGILDALIIPNEYKEQVLHLDTFGTDRYLFAKPEILSHTLEEFLIVDELNGPNITRKEIEDVLNSILVMDHIEGSYISETGHYGMGLIKGKISGEYQSKFIGSSSRKRYKAKMIQNLESELESMVEYYQFVKSQLEMVNSRISILDQEYNARPSLIDLETAINQIKDAKYNYIKCEEEVKRQTEKERETYKKLIIVREEVFKLTNKIALQVNSGSYKNAISAAKDYQKNLYELEKVHYEYLQRNVSIQVYLTEYDNNQSDIDGIRYDLQINDRKQSELKVNIANLEEQLKLTDYESIKGELESCIKLLKEIPSMQIAISNSIKELEVTNKFAYKNLEDFEKKLEVNKIEYEHYLKLFNNEYQLGYVKTYVEQDLFFIAKHILKDIDNINVRDKDKIISSLYEKYQLNTPVLRDYFIHINPIFVQADFLPHQLQSGERLDIVGKVRGKDANLYRIIEFIDESMDECQKLLREKDRELFEDILVNNISKKIRAKIYHSDKWVDKMNHLMESMNTSSGLKFSLKWSSKKAESEEQLDSSELVELLKLDGNLMKQEDIERLSAHFRSKLNEARRVTQDNHDHRTFHLIIKEILDYRRWFEFKLYFTKTGQNKKELTNNAFYQFSGGEKAMAMYVPLFSAVYAKYEGARSNCPKLISLDEAFAGVDEKNIRDMFRLLSELKFDFIINSQILWGDYDTIDSLAISELIRIDNADYVTVVRYRWNGQKKELVG